MVLIRKEEIKRIEINQRKRDKVEPMQHHVFFTCMQTGGWMEMQEKKNGHPRLKQSLKC